jgi:hypothetical protein
MMIYLKIMIIQFIQKLKKVKIYLISNLIVLLKNILLKDDKSRKEQRRTSLTKKFMSDINLNEKLSLANSNEDNNHSSSSESSFNANIENDHVSSSNIANNYIYLLNNDINRIINSEEEEEKPNHLNHYLPVYKPNKLLNNDSLTTTTASSTISISNNQIASSSNDYDYIYNKYKNSTNLMQTFKSIQLQSNDDKQQK